MQLFARVPVRVSDERHCSIHCAYYSDYRWAGMPTMCTLWLTRGRECRPLRLSRDGRAVRWAACRRACEVET